MNRFEPNLPVMGFYALGWDVGISLPSILMDLSGLLQDFLGYGDLSQGPLGHLRITFSHSAICLFVPRDKSVYR